VEVPEIWL